MDKQTEFEDIEITVAESVHAESAEPVAEVPAEPEAVTTAKKPRGRPPKNPDSQKNSRKKTPPKKDSTIEPAPKKDSTIEPAPIVDQELLLKSLGDLIKANDANAYAAKLQLYKSFLPLVK